MEQTHGLGGMDAWTKGDRDRRTEGDRGMQEGGQMDKDRLVQRDRDRGIEGDRGMQEDGQMDKDRYSGDRWTEGDGTDGSRLRDTDMGHPRTDRP